MALPYRIENGPAIGGVIKRRAEDFVVHEIPRYEPCGDGEHVMAEIEKTGISTLDAIDWIARRLKVPRRDIGYAGLKDTRAVTRQWITIRGTTPEAVNDVASDKIKILFADRHRNKLRVGHLAGNTFSIKVRDVDPMKVVTLAPSMRELSDHGMPNYFGPQRFGRRDRNDALGLAYARGDTAELLSELLGRPNEQDADDERAARQAYDAGDVAQALELWPRQARDERAVLAALQNGDPAKAVNRIDRHVQSLWLSALQSRLFNAVMANRVRTLDRLVDGDLAYKHDNGATFRCDNAAAEQSRADDFAISATGPLVGGSMMTPCDAAGEMELRALEAAGIPNADLHGLYNAGETAAAWLKRMPPGTRRPIRVRPVDLRADSGIDDAGPYVRFEFALPAGAYATTLLREFMRNDGQ